MRAFLAFLFAAAIVMMPVIASAQITQQVCLDYCEGEKGKTTESCNSNLAKSLGKKSVRDCFRDRDASYKNCKGGCMCNPPHNGLPCPTSSDLKR
jgi:hypothetical protein